MRTLSVPYQGQVYRFEYYMTTIDTENIVFLITEDEEAARMLKDDHFFITMDMTRPGNYCFNVIRNTEDEVAFKGAISDLVVRRFLVMATGGFLMN